MGVALPGYINMAPKLSIHGLKLSPELILLRLPPGSDPPARQIFRKLAANKINLTSVVLEGTPKGLAGACCIDAGDRLQVERALAGMMDGIETTTAVGALTVFPHRRQLPLLTAILGALGASRIPLLAIASSLSALTFILPYRRLEESVAAICNVARLPANHAPFQPQFRVRQI